jgi:hypothetical protein
LILHVSEGQCKLRSKRPRGGFGGASSASPRPSRRGRSATSKVIEAIDDVAEVVTGDRGTFYRRDATTPGEALPPVEWQTVK